MSGVPHDPIKFKHLFVYLTMVNAAKIKQNLDMNG